MAAASSPAAKAPEQPASSDAKEQDIGGGAGLSSLLGKLSAQFWPITEVCSTEVFNQCQFWHRLGTCLSVACSADEWEESSSPPVGTGCLEKQTVVQQPTLYA